MSFKNLTQLIVIAIILFACFASPGNALAWSNCGGSYVVQWGDTISAVAARCGTTVAALYAANPWTNGYLYAGQVLAIPDGGYDGGYYPPPQNASYNGTYTVQWGDSFSKIAQRFGVSVHSLWAANPYIWDINHIYPGQVLNIPGSYSPSYPSSNDDWFKVRSNSNEELVQRSYGTVPPGSPKGTVKLINSASAQVYVSLQGTTSDGAEVIREYPVEGSMKESIPAAWYTYVAWVGGQEFVGQFKLGGGSNQTLVFYINKVVVK
jgi:LysM repeat protein